MMAFTGYKWNFVFYNSLSLKWFCENAKVYRHTVWLITNEACLARGTYCHAYAQSSESLFYNGYVPSANHYYVIKKKSLLCCSSAMNIYLWRWHTSETSTTLLVSADIVDILYSFDSSILFHSWIHDLVKSREIYTSMIWYVGKTNRKTLFSL